MYKKQSVVRTLVWGFQFRVARLSFEMYKTIQSRMK